MVFKFSDPTRYAGVDAQPVGEALQALAVRSEDDAPRVVQAARHPGSPLHGLFEWDQARAATQYRTQQARLLIRSVVRVTPETSAPPEASRAVVTAAVPPEALAGTEDQVAARALRDLRTWAKRHAAHPRAAVVRALAEAPLDEPADVRAARLLRLWREHFADLPAFAPVMTAVGACLAEARASA